VGTRERVEFGRNQRRKLKRSDHAHWDATQRKQDPVEIILAVNRERIASLVPIKMARMAASPFGYFRGNVPFPVHRQNNFAQTQPAPASPH
jgi:uncharacterized protein (DUF2252 family)